MRLVASLLVLGSISPLLLEATLPNKDENSNTEPISSAPESTNEPTAGNTVPASDSTAEPPLAEESGAIRKYPGQLDKPPPNWYTWIGVSRKSEFPTGAPEVHDVDWVTPTEKVRPSVPLHKDEAVMKYYFQDKPKTAEEVKERLPKNPTGIVTAELIEKLLRAAAKEPSRHVSIEHSTPDGEYKCEATLEYELLPGTTARVAVVEMRFTLANTEGDSPAHVYTALVKRQHPNLRSEKLEEYFNNEVRVLNFLEQRRHVADDPRMAVRKWADFVLDDGTPVIVLGYVPGADFNTNAYMILGAANEGYHQPKQISEAVDKYVGVWFYRFYEAIHRVKERQAAKESGMAGKEDEQWMLYLDMSLDNALIGLHPMITDFGVSVLLPFSDDGIKGDIAEEIIEARPYTTPPNLLAYGPHGPKYPDAELIFERSVDIWQFGLILYRLLHSKDIFCRFPYIRKYYQHVKNGFQYWKPPGKDYYIYWKCESNAKKYDPKVPGSELEMVPAKWTGSEELLHLLGGLLHASAQIRLETFDALKDDKSGFFKGINWDSLRDDMKPEDFPADFDLVNASYHAHGDPPEYLYPNGLLQKNSARALVKTEWGEQNAKENAEKHHTLKQFFTENLDYKRDTKQHYVPMKGES